MTLMGCDSLDDTVWHQATLLIKYDEFSLSVVNSCSISFPGFMGSFSVSHSQFSLTINSCYLTFFLRR